MDINFVVGYGGQLLPSTINDAEYLSKQKKGTVLRAKISKPRNGQFHRKYFALLNVAFENQERYDNFEDFRVECQLKAGHYKEHITTKGKIIYMPKSISYSKLDNDEFGKLYNEVLNVILKHFMQGATSDQIESEVQKFLGFM